MHTEPPSHVSYIGVLRVTPNTILFEIKPPVYNNPDVPLTAVGIVPVENTNIKTMYHLS